MSKQGIAIPGVKEGPPQSQPRGAVLEGKHRSFYWTGQL